MSIFDRLPSIGSFFRASPENPKTPLSNPANWLTDLFGSSSAGMNVTPNTALGLPGVYSAVRLLSESVAMLPLQIYEDSGTSKDLRKDHALYYLIHTKPSPFMTSYQWRQLMVTDITLWGNHYSLIMERDGTVPTSLMPFPPKDVSISVVDGKLWYIFETNQGKKIFDSSNVIHVKGLGFDGIRGKSVISIMRNNLGLGLAAQQTGSTFFKKGMKLDYAIEGAGQLSREGLENLRKTLAKYEGSDGNKTFLPLDMGMTVKQIGVPPGDAQFLESRKFSVTDIARMFRIPPPLLYDLERATFSNISELVLSYVKFSLTPLLANIEQELNDKLLQEREKGVFNIEFNVEGLLRGDVKQRSEYYKTMIQNGILSPNEVLRKENMNGYAGGDQHYMPANMMPVSPQTAKTNGNLKDLKELLNI